MGLRTTDYGREKTPLFVVARLRYGAKGANKYCWFCEGGWVGILQAQW